MNYWLCSHVLRSRHDCHGQGLQHGHFVAFAGGPPCCCAGAWAHCQKGDMKRLGIEFKRGVPSHLWWFLNSPISHHRGPWIFQKCLQMFSDHHDRPTNAMRILFFFRYLIGIDLRLAPEHWMPRSSTGWPWFFPPITNKWQHMKTKCQRPVPSRHSPRKSETLSMWFLRLPPAGSPSGTLHFLECEPTELSIKLQKTAGRY